MATILDLGSRRILGWAMDTSMTTDLVLRALNMAVRTRGSNAVAGTIMHSDRARSIVLLLSRTDLCNWT